VNGHHIDGEYGQVAKNRIIVFEFPFHDVPHDQQMGQMTDPTAQHAYPSRYGRDV